LKTARILTAKRRFIRSVVMRSADNADFIGELAALVVTHWELQLKIFLLSKILSGQESRFKKLLFAVFSREIVLEPLVLHTCHNQMITSSEGIKI